MDNFTIQLNNNDKIKTLNEIVEETFNVKKPVIDVSFFYNEKSDFSETKNNKTKDLKIER